MNEFEVKADLPRIANVTYNILGFGAQAGGDHLNTQAVQTAVDTAHQNGGGRVIIPPGMFLIGSIVLKSGVELHLEKDAVLLGSPKRADYFGCNRWLALILADGQTDIAITGTGTINGQGRELALNTIALYHAGELEDPGFNHRRHRTSERHRPQLIEMVNCRRVKVSGVILKNAACWVQVYAGCRDLTIDRLWVESDAFWNNDGIDIEDCQNVRITNCDVNTADDGITLKSKTGTTGHENIYIANCRIRSSASAIKFGTESHIGFRNVKIRNISVHDTYRSAIALESVDGAKLENIDINGVFANNVGNAIFIRLGQRHVAGKMGCVKNVRIRNVKARVAFGRADSAYDLRGPGLSFFHNPIPASITGIPNYPVENVTLENIEISYPGRANKGMAYIPLDRLDAVPENQKGYPEFTMFEELPAWGFYVRHVTGLTMKNVYLRLAADDFRSAFVFDDVTDLQLAEINLPRALSAVPFVWKDVVNGRLDDTDKTLMKLIKG